MNKTQKDFNTAYYRWYNNDKLRKHVTSKALNEVKNKRQFTIAWLFEDVRRLDFVGRDGVHFKVDNSLKPAYARLLLNDYPECKPYLKIRPSRFDGMEL